jgi:murein DD-endopeptidase MepM/ murein hydrolase activator NlpD
MHPPLDEMRITSPFGPRTSPITGRAETHGGVDFAAIEGTPVYALASGLVTDSRNGDFARAKGLLSYGERIFIAHNDGSIALFAHLKERFAKVGHQVSAGELIGTTGKTGDCTGPHLHLGLIVEGRFVDPMPMIEQSNERSNT